MLTLPLAGRAWQLWAAEPVHPLSRLKRSDMENTHNKSNPWVVTNGFIRMPHTCLSGWNPFRPPAHIDGLRPVRCQTIYNRGSELWQVFSPAAKAKKKDARGPKRSNQHALISNHGTGSQGNGVEGEPRDTRKRTRFQVMGCFDSLLDRGSRLVKMKGALNRRSLDLRQSSHFIV